MGGCVAAALCASTPAQVPEFSLRAQQRLKGGRPEDFELRQALLRSGEARLASGDADGAEVDFDRAAQMLHAADTEIALVRTYMQLGRFRQALAFCAHTAGVHRDVVAAAGLYAWLLHLGGQGRVALQRLDEADRLYPGEPMLAEVRSQIVSPWSRADHALRELPARLAPYAPHPPLPSSARVAGTGALLPSGRIALVDANLVAGAQALWLRNGLGQTRPAHLSALEGESGLAMLRPQSAWPALPAVAAPILDPFGGRPGYTAEFPLREDAQPDWPLLRLGFLGPVSRDPHRRVLGLELPAGPRGGPVLDEAGRWVGVALAAKDRYRWLTASSLRSRFAQDLGSPERADAPKLAPDAVYERALRLTVQVLVT